MAENLQHEDFGEKIGGAKKDLWKDRGLYVDDLGAMNEREAEKFVKKDNVWKKPDYQAMLDDGVPLGVVYFIKKARDSLGASPQYRYSDKTPELRRARQEEYIETVRQLQAVIEDVRTLDDAMQAYDRFLIQNGYVEQVQGWASGTHYRATKKSLDNPVITNKLVQALHIRSASHFDRDFTQKAQQEQFGVSKDQKMPKGYAIHFNDGKNTYSRNNDWKPGTYYVTKGYSILQTNLESREAALKWVQDFARQRSKGGKVRFTPPQLAHVRRTGPDYRSGQEITGQHYLDTFGFRGGEFGNWMNQNDRQASLNMGFEALKDLAAALQISDQDIAFGGTLAIAFGARGSGNAAAHYEPLRKVINLTKMHGAGSLAHEWWHGFDDYLGAKMGAKGMLSEQPRLYPLFQKLIDTMKYKPETPEQAAKRTEAQNSRTKKNAASWLDSAVLGSLKRYGNESTLEQYVALKDAFLSGEVGSVDQISALKKSVSGHVIPKSDRERLEMFERMLHRMQEQETPQIGRTETDYYRNSVKMGKECEKDGGYLRTPEVAHTGNEWRKTGNWRDAEEISNRVYKMTCSVWEDTKYDRETKQSVPVAWYVTWDVYVNSPKEGYGEKIAGQNQKRYTDKAAAMKYLDGRKKAYSHLFTEISPQIPKEYEHHFTVHGTLLPGYTVEGQEPVKAEHTAAEVSEGDISLPEKAEKPSVLGKLAAAKLDAKESGQPVRQGEKYQSEERSSL